MNAEQFHHELSPLVIIISVHGILDISKLSPFSSTGRWIEYPEIGLHHTAVYAGYQITFIIVGEYNCTVSFISTESDICPDILYRIILVKIFLCIVAVITGSRITKITQAECNGCRRLPDNLQFSSGIQRCIK